jgi:hypothetical protein
MVADHEQTPAKYLLRSVDVAAAMPNGPCFGVLDASLICACLLGQYLWPSVFNTESVVHAWPAAGQTLRMGGVPLTPHHMRRYYAVTSGKV